MKKQKVLLVGAGVAGKDLLKAIRQNKSLNIQPLGFIDDGIYVSKIL